MQSTHRRRAILVISMFGYLTHPRCAGENRKLVYAGYLWVCGATGEYMRPMKEWLLTGGAILNDLHLPPNVLRADDVRRNSLHFSERSRSQAETVERKGSQAGETNDTLTEGSLGYPKGEENQPACSGQCPPPGTSWQKIE